MSALQGYTYSSVHIGVPSLQCSRHRKPLVVKASIGDEGRPASTAATLAKLLQLGVKLQRSLQSEDYVSARNVQNAIEAIDPASKLGMTAEQVKEQLRNSVMEEQYEEAAQLRDRLVTILGAKLKLEEEMFPSSKRSVPLPPHLRSRWYYKRQENPICYPPTSSERSTAGILATLTSVPAKEAAVSLDGHHHFEYTFTITNQGTSPVRLLRTCWHVTDGFRKIRTVRRDGVQGGKQVILLPGQCLEVKESCRLGTPLGSIEGHVEVLPCQLPSSQEPQSPGKTQAHGSVSRCAGQRQGPAPEGEWSPGGSAVPEGGAGMGAGAFKVFLARIALRSSGAATPGAQAGGSAGI